MNWLKKKFDLSQQDVLRLIADLVMVNAAFLVALAVRYIWSTGIVGNSGSMEGLDYYIQAYLSGAPILSLISVFVFHTSGFYTLGKAYRSKYRLLIVLQAVSLTYLIFGSFSYFMGEAYELPRGAYVIAYVMTLLILGGSRLWSGMWRSMVRAESELLAKEPSKIKS